MKKTIEFENDLIRITCEICKDNGFSLTAGQLMSNSHERYIAIPRQIIAFILRMRGYSLVEVAATLNRKDHSTIINTLKNHEMDMQTSFFPSFSRKNYPRLFEAVLNAIDAMHPAVFECCEDVEDKINEVKVLADNVMKTKAKMKAAQEEYMAAAREYNYFLKATRSKIKV